MVTSPKRGGSTPKPARAPDRARQPEATTTTTAPSTPRRKSGALDPDTVVALEEERDFLLKSLDDLDREHDAGDVDDVDYDELRDDYTARAAAAIRALGQHAAVMRADKGGRSWLKVAAVLLLVAIVGGLAGAFVASSSGQREPGGSLTGDIRSSSLGEIQRAKGLTGEAQQALSAGDAEQAIQLFQQALAAYRSALDIDPNNAEALTYQGWLFHNLFLLSDQAGATDSADQFEQGAIDSLNQALTIDPTYSDALVFRAVIALRQGRPADSLADLGALPPGGLPTEMQGMVDKLRSDAQAAVDGVTTTTTTG